MDGDLIVGADDIGIGAGRAALDRRRWDRDDIAQRFQQQIRIDELARKQLVLGVLELSAQFDHARGGVDFVVYRQQSAGRQFLHIGAIISVDLQWNRRVHLGHDVRQLVLGDWKNDGDRLQLSDDRDHAGGRGLHVIAGIDETQAHAAIDRRDDVRVDQIELLRVDQGLIGLHRSLGTA